MWWNNSPLIHTPKQNMECKRAEVWFLEVPELWHVHLQTHDTRFTRCAFSIRTQYLVDGSRDFLAYWCTCTLHSHMNSLHKIQFVWDNRPSILEYAKPAKVVHVEHNQHPQGHAWSCPQASGLTQRSGWWTYHQSLKRCVYDAGESESCWDLCVAQLDNVRRDYLG